MAVPLVLRPTLLIVDDEPSIRGVLSRVLERQGFDTKTAKDGLEGIQITLEFLPDLVILDLNLPDLQGEEVFRRIRENPACSDIPALMMTGKSTEGLSVRCLNGGADDYITKPFDLEEIVARVRALLRRSRRAQRKETVIECGRLVIRVEERCIRWDGQPIPTLAPKEFQLLRALVSQSPSVIERTSLAREVWGVPLDQVHERTLDVHMRRIRKKLGPIASECLKTIPSIGFQWHDPSFSVAVPEQPLA